MPENYCELNCSNLLRYADSLNSIFRMYIEDINPFIVKFEVSKCEFPAEIQNEIRAIYGHLIRAAMAENEAQALRNIDKMKSHSKRALLDCFKYTSILYSDEYEDFMKRYAGIDLTYIKNGEFIKEIVERRNNAKKALQDAKIAETTNITENSLFDLYQNAYIQFEELRGILQNAEEDADFLKRRAIKKNLGSVVSLAIGVAGFIVGLIGIL